MVLELGALLLDDPDLVFDAARIVGADLRPEAVLEGRDDPSAVRVVFRVRARDHVDVDRQAGLEAPGLDRARLSEGQESGTDALRGGRPHDGCVYGTVGMSLPAVMY